MEPGRAAHARPLSIAMIDIDHFKKVNDTHGHDAGDAILRRVAAILRDQTRGTDAVCRIGGEEFLIIFSSRKPPRRPPGLQPRRMSSCRGRMHQRDRRRFRRVRCSATISIGVATRTPAMAKLADLLKAADEALYAAKHAGRHVVCVAAIRN